MRNGYQMIYMPSHHRADSTGCVYEHILIAEEKLGRKLKANECVHHLNEVRNDNRPENLIVFKTVADHTAFHMGCDIILEGDVYIALQNKNSICPQCGRTKDHKAKMCIHCWSVLCKKVEQPSKEELEKMILSMSFVQIGKQFGVSDNTVRNWCKNYELPYKYRDLHPKKETPEKKVIDNTYKVKMTNEHTSNEFNNLNYAIDYLINNDIAKDGSKRYTIRDNIVRAFKKDKMYYGFHWLIYK